MFETVQDDENTMSILVASDVHLGYIEKNGERGKDSFVALEEIFTIAKERNVDFILLGGDLFHENKPSRKTLHTAMELFQKYCLGDRPCNVKVVSDQAVNFGHTSSSITCVNYENPNVNISLPVFSIHGNHDDPSGAGELSAIDLLSVTGLLNHFGKQTKLDVISLSPVLLQKGTTKLALYGLGSMRDERLHRLFLNHLVTMLRPKESLDDWFNIFVLHQNRSKHGATNYIPEQFLDDFFDLIIWGHEHECLINPQWNPIKGFFVMQPGSPVATSLCEGESKQKKVAVVKIRGREMKTDIIPLKTVRQLYVENITLADGVHPPMGSSPEAIEALSQAYCEETVERLLLRAQSEKSGHPRQPRKPLIRLRVDYSGFDIFNAYRFGAKFADRVSNPENIVHFLKKSVKKIRDDLDVKDMDDLIGAEVVENVKMEDLVQEYLNSKDEKEQMKVLSARGVSQAVSEFVTKQEKDAIKELCCHQIKKTKNYLQGQTFNLDQNEIKEQIKIYQTERLKESSTKESQELKEILERTKAKRSHADSTYDISSEEEEISDPVVQPKPKRGRGARKTRGSRGGARGKTKTSPAASLSNYFSSSRNSRPGESQKMNTTSNLGKRSQDKGVSYISSDDDGNPFAKL
ncbi:double-strand break repair protein MRE11 [Ciona intestinalis]